MIKSATYWAALFLFDSDQTLTLIRPEFTTHEKCIAFVQSYDWREGMKSYEPNLADVGNLVSVGCHRSDLINTRLPP
jgi:hypothetical protein